MPVRPSYTRRQHYDVLGIGPHTRDPNNRMFDSTYLSADANNEKWLYAGTALAVDSSTSKYVPYSATAAYGTGSDTPVGFTETPYDMTLGDVAVQVVVSGAMKEDYCLVFGGALGTVPSGVKTTLSNLIWV